MRQWRRVVHVASPALIPLVLAIQVAGCGGHVASSRSISTTWSVPPSVDDDATRDLSLGSLGPGAEVDVVLLDGSVLRGRYRGLERMSEEAYRGHVARAAAAGSDAAAFPGLGSELALQPRRGNPFSARLLAFGYRGLELKRPEGENAVLVSFEDLDSVRDSSGRVWTRAALSDEAESGRLPAFSEVVIGVVAGERRIPVDQVAQVSYRSSSSGATEVGLVLAIVLGVLALSVAATSAHGWGWGWAW